MSKKIVFFKTETLNATPLQFLVLIQLLEGPKYGYEILQNLREDFSDSWKPQTGTIYPALKGMIKKGQIEKIKEDDKELYQLSGQSETYLKEVETYVIEFMFMTNQFIESIIKRIPGNYAKGIFDNLLKTGSLEIIPEDTFVQEIDRLTSGNQTKEVLVLRKKILLGKLSIIENKLKEIN